MQHHLHNYLRVKKSLHVSKLHFDGLDPPSLQENYIWTKYFRDSAVAIVAMF